MKKKDRQESKGFFWFLLVPCILIIMFQVAGILDSTDWRLQDYRYQKGGLARPDIFVIGIDEETMMEYGSWQNWSRTGTAALLQVLNQDPELAPAVIGLDIGFFGNSTDEADEALAQAASLVDNVVTTSYASFGKEVSEGEDGTFSMEEAVLTYEVPYDSLRQQIRYGFSNVPVDNDGIVRHSLYLLHTQEGETEYSFAVELYRRYMGALPSCIENGAVSGYIPYAGSPFDFYGSETAGLSFSKVVSGEIPAELFTGSIVLVGPYTTGMMDSYYTAVSHDIPMYGVEVHANILQSFLDEDQKKEVGLAGRLLISAVVMGLVLCCLRLQKIQYSALLTALILLAYWAASGFVYQKGLVLPILYPTGGALILYVCYIVWRYAGERKAKKRLEGIFGKYVSKEVAASIVKGGEDALKLGGQKKDAAILFVDIRGFTPLSESLLPERVVEILNRYLELATETIFNNKGTVDKFIGDAVMAVYNAPLDLDDYVFRAVKTGWEMTQGAYGLEKELISLAGRRVSFGVGINCGEVVVGNIGTTSRMDYTAIGNTVNIAARLESQAKAGEVVISQEVYNRLNGRIQVESLGKQYLKGIAGKAEIYRVVGINGEK